MEDVGSDETVTRGTPIRAILSFGGGPPRATLPLLLLLAACVTTTTVTYLPSPEQPRLALAEGQATLARFVGVECERLRAAGRADATVPVTVALDSAGNATSAELARSTGDARVDGIVGAVAAQLRLDPPPAGAARATVRAGYRCDEHGGVAATLERP